MSKREDQYVVTQNACNLCTPLGASLAFKGVSGGITLLHGSQGCSTYIRRYMISHFKEPIDIASSNFSEEAAVFGGSSNLKAALKNVISQYSPSFIGVATTCLSETIGDDVPRLLREFERENPEITTKLAHVSTPAYRGTHADGFHAAVRAIVETFAEGGDKEDAVSIFSAMISPEDIRYLRRATESFGIKPIIIPDYSDTLDGSMWTEYHGIPEGGSTVEEISSVGRSLASVELGLISSEAKSAGGYLASRFGIERKRMRIPVGVEASDEFFNTLAMISGKPINKYYARERGRLIDAYTDGHKYIFEKRCAVYGEEDFVVSMAAFLCEIGIIPAVCVSGGRSGRLERVLREIIPTFDEMGIAVKDGGDYTDLEELSVLQEVDFFLGASKAYKSSRKLNKPLIRVGFPIHDRFGAARITSLGYSGTNALFDRIVNMVIETRQESSSVGYSYI